MASSVCPEYQAIRGKISVICDCIAEPDVAKFSSELLQSDLISNVSHQAAIATNSMSPTDKVTQLVTQAMNKVSNSPEYFERFASILESRNKVLASTLRNDVYSMYAKANNCQAAPLANFSRIPRNVERPHSTAIAPQRTRIELQAIGQPGKPYTHRVFHDKISLKWSPPKVGQVASYVLSYHSVSDPEHACMDMSNRCDKTIKRLTPKTAYVFKVKAETGKDGYSQYSEPSDAIETLQPPPPGKPYAARKTNFQICITWKKPECDGIQYYRIYSRSTEDPADKPWSISVTDDDKNSYMFTADPEKHYVFKVSAITSGGPSLESELSEPISMPWGARLLICCKKLNSKRNELPTYQLHAVTTMKKRGILKVSISGAISARMTMYSSLGEPVHKVLMLVGATGAGKSTLINAMANYIMGVDWEDEIRFKLIHEETAHDQSKSQTKFITAYTFYKQEFKETLLPCTLTVVDTPGFYDIENDQKIIKQIKDFFSLQCDEGKYQLHGIGFVTQAPLARLTATQRYVFDSILSVFGKDVADNIFLMVTFADGTRPPVLDAARAAGVPFSSHFKFNNSALFASNKIDDEDLNFDCMFWKMTENCFKVFFDQFAKAKPTVDLKLTREVLQTRGQLKLSTQRLQSLILAGLKRMDELKQEKLMLDLQQANMMANKNFTVAIKVTKMRKIDLPKGHYHLTCVTCNVTCDGDCLYNDGDKYKSSAMNNRGSESATCRVCPSRCSWTVHVCQPYKLETYQEIETRTIDQLKAKYESAMTRKYEVEAVIKKMSQELKQMHQTVLRKIDEVKRILERLQEIALRQDPLTQVDYVDMLIESERQEARPGWIQRVQALEQVRKQAEILSTIAQQKQGINPFFSID